jgi:hypothetical protein
LDDGGYRLAVRQPGRFVAVGSPIVGRVRDVVVTATFRKVGGPPGGGYGLIVRDQAPEARDGIDEGGWYYLLAANDHGEIGIWRREEDRWIDLVPWTPSAAVRAGGAANVLAAQAIGQHLTLVVNGVTVATRLDAAPADGGVGVLVGGDLNEVLVERFAVQVPA